MATPEEEELVRDRCGAWRRFYWEDLERVRELDGDIGKVLARGEDVPYQLQKILIAEERALEDALRHNNQFTACLGGVLRRDVLTGEFAKLVPQPPMLK